VERYSRQAGLVDQEKLKNARVGIFGLGGLGNACIAYLSAAGIGKLVLVDRDIVEESNLNRQILFKPEDVGKKKIDAAERWIRHFNPEIEVEKFEEICEDAVKRCDIVVDALDNWESRKRLWDLAFKRGKIVVHGAADEWYGQVAVLLSREDGEKVMGKGAGCLVVGAVAGVIGALMALETIRAIQKKPERSFFLAFDGREIRKFEIKRSPWELIIAKPDEIWIKSPATRKKLMRMLLEDLRERVEGKVYARGPHIFVEPYSRKNLQATLRTPGIKVSSPAIRVKLEELEREFEKIAREILTGKRFRITAKRVWKGYEKNSLEVQSWLGRIGSRYGKVDLKEPEVEVFVEIHRGFALLYTKRLEGAGGLPYGSQGRALVLFSGGIDSPVAAFLLAKRGVAVDLLFLNPLGPVLESRIFRVYEKLRESIPRAKLYVIDVGELVNEIRGKVKEGLRQVVLKRFMYRIASKVAEKKGYKAIATGESMGQTSSQTLHNLTIIEKASTKPVLRPLLTLDKSEITGMARQLGTFEESSKIEEFCALERHSNARADEKEVLEEERKLSIRVEEIVGSLREAELEIDAETLEPTEEDLKEAHVIKLWEGIPELEKLERDKKYVFVCFQGLKAAEMAFKARKLGIKAFALGRDRARKLGLL